MQLGGKDFVPASVRQIHSSHSFVVDARPRRPTGLPIARRRGLCSPRRPTRPAGDGLMTAEPGILLTIRIADCLPVLLVDPPAACGGGGPCRLARRAGAGHRESRRGYAARFGSDPQKLIAALGPSIRACCYEVGEEVVEAFHGSFRGCGRFFRTLPNRPEAATDRHSILFLSAYPPGTLPNMFPPRASI